MSAPDRGALVDRSHPELPIRRQCVLLGVARSGVYRAPPDNEDDVLAMMRRIDELFTAWPFLGSRRMTAMLRAEGHVVNRKRVRRLMRKMGIAALGPRPRTTKPAPGPFHYLLRGLAIERPNQVWCANITLYMPIGRAPGARDISLSLARSGDRAAAPGLVRRHHIYICRSGAAISTWSR
jgi:putative transposase